MTERFFNLLFSIVSILPYIYCKELSYALLTAGLNSPEAVPAIELAEKLINADSSILPGYNLTHTPVVDTMVCISILRGIIIISDACLYVFQSQFAKPPPSFLLYPHLTL